MGIELIAQIPSYSKSLGIFPCLIAVIHRLYRTIRTWAWLGFLSSCLCDIHIVFLLTGHN